MREAVELLVANGVMSLDDVSKAPDCQSWPGSQARERARAAQTHSFPAQVASVGCMRLLRAAQQCAPPAGPPPPGVRGAAPSCKRPRTAPSARSP
eukprot:3384569-Pyramimonas_sp.AAC.1